MYDSFVLKNGTCFQMPSCRQFITSTDLFSLFPPFIEKLLLLIFIASFHIFSAFITGCSVEESIGLLSYDRGGNVVLSIEFVIFYGFCIFSVLGVSTRFLIWYVLFKASFWILETLSWILSLNAGAYSLLLAYFLCSNPVFLCHSVSGARREITSL